MQSGPNWLPLPGHILSGWTYVSKEISEGIRLTQKEVIDELAFLLSTGTIR